MPELFADTSGWGNLIDPLQPYHSLAGNIYREARRHGRPVVTTNYIIAELVTLMTSPLRIPRSSTIAFIESLITSPCVEIVHIDRQLHERAWQLLKDRNDKEWSLADCASFVVMQQRGIREAFTNDHHFEQNGFIRLLK